MTKPRRAQICFLTPFPSARSTTLGRILPAIDRAVDWSRFLPVIEDKVDYPRPGAGRRPWAFDLMSRIIFVQWLAGLNDRQAEELLIDAPVVVDFVGLDPALPKPPDSETIGAFRRRLRRFGQDEAIVEGVLQQLAEKGVTLLPGSHADPRWSGPDL